MHELTSKEAPTVDSEIIPIYIQIDNKSTFPLTLLMKKAARLSRPFI